MSRSGYVDDCYDSAEEQWANICWRGAVASALRGRRGQAFLRELLAALEALPEHELAAGAFVTPTGEVCALGAVAKARELDTAHLGTEDDVDPEAVAELFDIAKALAAEVMWVNDDCWFGADDATRRYERVVTWVRSQIKEPGR